MAIINNNNVQSVKFLRNGTVYETHALALSALKAFDVTTEQDGTAILARYNSIENEQTVVKTLVGWVYINGTSKYITIQDVEGASGDVAALLGDGITTANTVTMQLTTLSGNNQSTSADTSVAGAKKYTDGKIDALDYTGVTTGDAVVITNVTEADGVVSATSANVGNLKLTDYSKGSNSGTVATSDTINQAIAKLENQIDAANDKVNALDLTVVSGDGEVIVSVAQEDGQVAATKSAIKDIKLTGYSKDASKTGAIEATDDVEDALSKLENKTAAITISNDDHSINVTPATSGTNIAVNIKSGEKVIKLGNNGIYTDIKIASATPSSTIVKEEYNLLDSDGNALGASIKIYKDSHIVSITYITDSTSGHYQNLEYKYIDADGVEQTEYVDISSLVLEAEFASGITITDHVAHGVVDPASEQDESNVAFLTVGAAGFKVSGIKDAIDTKINKLDADVSGNSTHVTVGVEEVDGKVTAVTVSESNVANADDLAELSGKTFTVATSSNASIATAVTAAADGTKSVDIITDASKIKMTGFTAAESGFTTITSASTVTEAVKAIETEMISNEEVTSAALNDLETNLNNEIAARKAVDGQNGQTYAANSGKAYISGATSLNDADVKLNDALASLDADVIKSVKVNNVTLAETSNAVNVQISSTAASGAASSPIEVNTDNSTGAVTLQIQFLDCGTY